jgi:hypothetical protein
MPIPFPIRQRIQALDPAEFAALMGRLLALEAARLNRPLGSTRATLRVNVADKGEDGLATSVPADHSSPLPPGDSLFQFKTNADNAAFRSELKNEIVKERPQEVLRNGGSYVVAWSKDATGAEYDEALEELRAAAGGDRDRAFLWAASIIEELCWRNPAIFLEFQLGPLGSVLPFVKWRAQDAKEPTYASDPEREALLETIRSRVREGTDVRLFHLVGDAGVGKAGSCARRSTSMTFETTWSSPWSLATSWNS